jgi:diguanylate cyclase (GGDEF)-like protein
MIYDFDTASTSPKGQTHAMQPARDRRNATHPMATVGATARSLEILQQLQTTLDVEQMVELFVAEVGALVRVDGAQYSHDSAAISFRWQRQARHSCAYRLTVEGEQLGELSFFRSKPFDEPELRRIEQLLTALVYPLRNSLRYRQALSSARHDPLTGLYNRTALEEQVQREIQIARRHETPLSMMVIDLDHFKRINDLHGHRAGDLALSQVARSLNACVRDSDLLFRYGGEEFVVLLANTDQASAELVAGRVLACIRETVVELDKQPSLQLTASAGVTSLRPEDDSTTLFERADQAMYAAKNAGRNRSAAA